jgi:hypothetical protein
MTMPISHGPNWKSHARTVAISVAVLFAILWVRNSIRNHAYQRDYQKAMQEVDKDIKADITKRTADLQEANRQKQLEEEAYARLKAADRLREEQQKQREQEELQQEARATKEELTQQQDDLAQQQRQAATYAATKLQTISLSPTIHLSKSLEASGVSVKMAGEHWQDMQAAYQQKDWMAVLRLVLRESEMPTDGGFPEQSTINGAVRDLAQKQFRLLLKPQFTIPEGKKLHYLTLLDDGSFQISDGWFAHPDGIAWCHSWQPLDQELFIFVCKPLLSTTDDVNRIHDAYMLELKQLKVRKDLGDVSEEQYRSQCRHESDKQRAAYISLMTKY